MAVLALLLSVLATVPGALLALSHLGREKECTLEAARAGVTWLLDLQNADGGMPTFCRGWTGLPFDRSSPDLTAHALLAWTAWHKRVGPDLQPWMRLAIQRALDYLARTQHVDGSWAPLWFGNQHADEVANLTYGTSRVPARRGCCWAINRRPAQARRWRQRGDSEPAAPRQSSKAAGRGTCRGL